MPRRGVVAGRRLGPSPMTGGPCLVCRSNSGEERISPGPVIHDGDLWILEHAYPSSLLGWVVIVLKRHAEALHELTPAELRELALIQGAAARGLHRITGCRKEYLVSFGEGPGFSHLHVHLVPRSADLPPDRTATGVFQHLREPEAAVPRETVSTFCKRLSDVIDAEAVT